MYIGFIDVGVSLSGGVPSSMVKCISQDLPESFNHIRELHITPEALFLDGHYHSLLPHKLSQADRIRQILDAVTFAVIERQDNIPLLHAALLKYRGKVILVPGKSGSGKTTLSYLLHHYGAQIFSDELIGISQPAVYGFPRLLHMRGDVITVLKAKNIAVDELFSTAEGAYVSVQYEHSPITASQLVVLQPDWNSAYRHAVLTPLSKANICHNFMSSCVNARNFNDHALAQLAGISRQSKGFKLSYNEPHALKKLLNQIVGEA